MQYQGVDFNSKKLSIGSCCVSRCHLKAFYSNFSKQVLLFEICGFKNCKIGSELVNISMGHPVHTFIYVAFGHGCVDKSRVKTIDFKARVGFGLNQGQ